MRLIWTFLAFQRIFCSPSLDSGQSWPNWLGPNHSGSIEGVTLKIPKGNEEFPRLWSAKAGRGWSAPIEKNGVVVLHDRVDDYERVRSLDLGTGKQNWVYAYPTSYRDDFGMNDGPRSTPAIAGNIVISHSPEGKVFALDLEDGKPLWSRDLRASYQSPKGFFGRCSSPLIINRKVILAVGGKKAGLIALSLNDGKTLWKSQAREAAYASCIPFERNGISMIISFLRDGLVVVDEKTGEELFFGPLRSPVNASVNAASPLLINDRVFLSSCYEVGASLWKMTFPVGTPSKPSFFRLWNLQERLDCHYSTPVAFQGHLFGFHGRQERGGALRCLRLSDGRVMWSESSLAMGNLLRLGERIICLTEKGELVIFKADAASYLPLFSQQILGSGRAHFAFSDGKLLARDRSRLVCYDLLGE